MGGRLSMARCRVCRAQCKNVSAAPFVQKADLLPQSPSQPVTVLNIFHLPSHSFRLRGACGVSVDPHRRPGLCPASQCMGSVCLTFPPFLGPQLGGKVSEHWTGRGQLRTLTHETTGGGTPAHAPLSHRIHLQNTNSGIKLAKISRWW